MRWFENVIAAISPETAARREHARLKVRALREVRNAYDGASVGRRTSGWRRVSTDANAETAGGALGRLRDASREMVRNNPHASRAAAVLAQTIIGEGIIPSFVTPDELAQPEAEAVAREFLDTEAIDAGGQMDLYGLQSLAARTVFEGGEVLFRRRRRKASDGLPLAFQVQILEPDFLDSTKDGPLGNGNVAVQGVEFNGIGRRVAYWLFDEHPGSRGSYRITQSRRVPAEDVIHAYRIDRPGQVRGVPWLAPVMLAVADYADLADAYRMRQKIAACFAAFETDYQGGTAESPLVSGGSSAGDMPVEEFSPGMIVKLPAGRDIKFATPPGVEGFAETAAISLREVAVGIGMPPFVLSGDYGAINFSAGRLGWLDYRRGIKDYQARISIRMICRRLEGWFREAMAIERGVTVPFRGVWTPPAVEMINPKEEIETVVSEVRAGRMTPQQMVRAAGKDPEQHFAEYARGVELIDRLGLILDSDPRRVSRAGLTQVRTDNTQFPDIKE
ncbi:phage portal protein [Oleispirillum naphthae]|uniref:phage portal protein n=1 Tax=Oleispirillum naphthae TaxID=2838853 RepID=UPI0030824227